MACSSSDGQSTFALDYDKIQIPDTIRIEQYRLLLGMRKFHKLLMMKLRKVVRKTSGEYEKKRIQRSLDKEERLTMKYNKRIKRMRKAIYYDVNTFEIE
tara:strand:+ start:2093 stop:2389 length:297 start_codon:yes stop_codon:yes gene_type:complete